MKNGGELSLPPKKTMFVICPVVVMVISALKVDHELSVWFGTVVVSQTWTS